MSYGCAVLFLNYLRYQLGFTFEHIVAAAGGFEVLAIPGLTKKSLAGVFSTLTGRPAASAYKEFTDLLQAHLPMGKPFSPLRDNVFPLRDPKHRAVSFSHSNDELNAVQDPETLLIKAQAGPMCPPNIYTYHNVNVSSQLTLSGQAWGFAQPIFNWALNGVVLNNAKPPQFTTVSMNVTDRVPGRGEPAVVVNLPVKCLISSSGFTSTLCIFNQSFPGNGTIEVSLSAVESLVSGDSPTTFNDKPSILTRRYNVLGTWNHDVATCNTKDFGLIYETMKSLAQLLVEDENRPNINPLVVRALADATRRYVEALDAVTGGSRGLDLAVANVFKELDAARAPLEPLTFYDSKTGLRILRKVVEVPWEVPPQASEEERIEGDQYQDSH